MSTLTNILSSSHPDCPPRFHTPSHQLKKTRASHVCQGCRKRKVKCDLIICGNPCSNCRADGIICVRLESKRSRNYRRQKQLDQNLPVPSHSISYESSNTQPTNAISQYPSASVLPPQALQSPSTLLSANIPSYVKPPRHGFSTDDTAFLASRKALTVPEAAIRDELIRSFVLYSHPYMPVVNLQDLFQSISLVDNSEPPCSLILLQAIIFSGSAFVSMSVLESLGFKTRKAARKAFYIKVKQLYEFDWEDDPVPVIQALLLITDWFETPDDQKDPWYWLGVCRILANRIGLGNDNSMQKWPSRTKKLLKRLWWMCVLRDRVMALATRKPLQFVGEEELNMPMLTVDDFETEPVTPSIALLSSSAMLTDTKTRQHLARLYIERLKLARLVASILCQNYALSSDSKTPAHCVMLYSPSLRKDRTADNMQVHRKLEQWKEALPSDCVFEIPAANGSERSDDDDALVLYRAELYMFSLMALGLLYRPLLSAKIGSGLGSPDFLLHDIKLDAERVANETARMAQLFCEQHLVSKLPPYATTFFISALPAFLVGIKTSSGAVYDRQRLKFRWCSEAISRQRDIWPTSDLAYHMVELMVAMARIKDPQGLLTVEGNSSNHFRDDDPLLHRNIGADSVRNDRSSTTLPSVESSQIVQGGNLNVHGNAFEDGAPEWASWLQFDDGLFSQLCNYPDAFAETER